MVRPTDLKNGGSKLLLNQTRAPETLFVRIKKLLLFDIYFLKIRKKYSYSLKFSYWLKFLCYDGNLCKVNYICLGTGKVERLTYIIIVGTVIV